MINNTGYKNIKQRLVLLFILLGVCHLWGQNSYLKGTEEVAKGAVGHFYLDDEDISDIDVYWSASGGTIQGASEHTLDIDVIWNSTGTFSVVVEFEDTDYNLFEETIWVTVNNKYLQGPESVARGAVAHYSLDTSVEDVISWSVSEGAILDESPDGMSANVIWTNTGVGAIIVEYEDENYEEVQETLEVQVSNKYLKGPKDVIKGSISHYYFDDDGDIDDTTLFWNVEGGSIEGDDIAVLFVDINWYNIGTGTVSVEYEDENYNYVEETLSVNITNETLRGPKDVIIGDAASHYYLDSETIYDGDVYWSANGGTIQGLNEYTLDVDIVWDSTSSGKSVTVEYEDDNYDLIEESIQVTVVDAQRLDKSSQNYIHTVQYQDAYTENELATVPNNDKIEHITYFDGIGRANQSIAIRAGGLEQDLVTHIDYDAYGRQNKDYLPFASAANNGMYRTDALLATNIFYNTLKYENTPNPFSEKELEASPLNRVLKQAAPGEDWKLGNGHEIEFEYQTNTATEVKYYTVNLTLANNTYTPALAGGTGYYSAGELYKTVTKDENHAGNSKNHTTEEFKDKQGRVVLKRTYGTSKINGVMETSAQHDTYYVYDDYGNLTYVLAPKAEPHTSLPDATKLNELCYQYKYDHKNRLEEKKIPGKDWEYIAYDPLDRPVLTADGNMRTANKALKTEYDAFGRVTKTGLVIGVSGSSHDAFKSHIDDAITTLYTENYYDRYTDIDTQGLSLPSNAVTGTQTQGLQTGSKVRVLDTNHFITSLLGYDAKGRLIYTGTHNPATDVVNEQTHTLDFVGRTTQTTTVETKNGNTLTKVDDYAYDHAGRLIDHDLTLNGQKEDLVYNRYDELGQLEEKTVGGGLQTVDYDYNVRGWLRHINDPDALGDDLFGFELDYGSLYNGNIQKTYWTTANDNIKRNYLYNYDGLNRLTYAAYYAPGSNWGAYRTSYTYDRNGNIKRLSRRNGQNVGIDNLTYAYDGNQLQAVTDYYRHSEGFNDGNTTGFDYIYDVNGNLKEDKNKGVDIMYNHLNLPRTVLNRGQRRSLEYTYDATGVKQEKKYTGYMMPTETTTYTPTAVYKNNNLELVFTPEGYAEPKAGGFTHVYQYKDHLGNNRLSYADANGNGRIDTPGSTAITVWEDGFEDKETGDWESVGAKYGRKITGFDTTKAKSGTTSGYITINSSGPWTDYYVHSNEWIDINNSTPTLYKFSGWVYVDPIIYRAQFYFFMNKAGETDYYTEFDYVETREKGKWVFIEKTVLVQPEIKKLNFRIDADGNYTGTVWFDDLKIEKLDMSQNEIVSETNYYPFGLAHKGYNEHVNSTNLGEQFKFNGKELNSDMDLGLYEMDFRQYDPTIGRFTGIDALSEERYWVSNYNFGQNNPIMRVDPTGLLDDYGIDQNGNVKLIEETDDDFDRLYAVDEDGNKVDTNNDGNTNNEDSVVVNDQTILPELSEVKETRTNSYHGKLNKRTVVREESSQNDLFKIFNFAANNTSVEFGLYRFNSAKGNQFGLGTYGNSSLSPGASAFGFESSQIIAGIHSHPRIPTTLSEEIGSMYGDRSITTRYINRGQQEPGLKYVYFPNSKNIYNINNRTAQPIFIRNAKGNYKRFYFGTLNSK